MKKVLFGLVAVALIATVSFTSCDDDNPVSCAKKLDDVVAAASAYSYDDNASCIAYKEALEDYINCDGVVDKSSYQAILESLPCY